MGLLDELIAAAKEAIDEQTGKQPQRGGRSGPAGLDELKERLRQAQAQQQAMARRQNRPSAPEPTPDAVRAAERKVEREAERTAERVAETQAAQAKATALAHPPADRFARLLRQPRTMRELMILKELIDKPLSLRRPRR